MASFGAGSVCGAFIGGVLTDKIGFFKVQYVSLFLTSIAFIFLMQMKTFYPLCITIFILAIIADSFRPANLTAIQAFSTKENLTRSLSLVRLAVNMGYAVGPFLGGYVASILGYDFLFLFNGLALFLGCISYYFLFRNRKHKATNIELNADSKKSLLMPWKDFRYLLYLFLFTLTIIVFMQLLYTAPLFFKTEYAFDEKLIGLIMGFNGLIIALFELPLIYKIENKIAPVAFVIIGSVMIGMGFLSFYLIAIPLFASILHIIFTTFGEILSFPFSNNYALSFSNDHNRGKYMGLYTMTFSFAHIASPLIGFYVIETWTYNCLWIGSALLCFFAATLIYLTKE